MDFKILFIFCIVVSVTILNVLALKRIKRNSLGESKNYRFKQDFVVLHTGKQDSKEHINYKEASHNSVLDKEGNYNASNDHTTDSDKKPDVVRPLAVILREREQKLNALQRGSSNKKQENSTDLDAKEIYGVKGNNEHLIKRYEATENSKDVQNRDQKRKRLPHIMHAASVVGAHQNYGDLNPFVPIEQLMRFGNMMMLKVGVDSSSNSLTPFSPRMLMAKNSLNNPQRNYYQQMNEPSFEYVINSIEGPQEDYFNLKTPLQSNSLIVQQPFTGNEPSELANLMQSALDTLWTNSDNEIELRCPIHHEKKSINNKEKGDDADIIQVCSCRFIKNTKDDNK